MDDLTVLITQHLKLNVTRMLQKALRVYVWIAKGLLRLATCGLVGRKQFALVAHNAHTASAAACHGFEDQGITDSPGLGGKLLLPLHDSVASGNGGQSGGFYFPARAVLLSHHLDDFCGRADERNLGGLANFREIGILGKETV